MTGLWKKKKKKKKKNLLYSNYLRMRRTIFPDKKKKKKKKKKNGVSIIHENYFNLFTSQKPHYIQDKMAESYIYSQS